MIKFGFKIRTRAGMVVDNLLIPGRDQAEAEKKVNQIYRGCEIIEIREVTPADKDEQLDFDGIINLISRQDDEPG